MNRKSFFTRLCGLAALFTAPFKADAKTSGRVTFVKKRDMPVILDPARTRNGFALMCAGRLQKASRERDRLDELARDSNAFYGKDFFSVHPIISEIYDGRPIPSQEESNLVFEEMKAILHDKGTPKCPDCGKKEWHWEDYSRACRCGFCHSAWSVEVPGIFPKGWYK